ncbi:MAG: hypothetical protein B9S36_01960 [Verrucomicrobiia bacterium Tous-C2TDCM]|nr:MAG: hypothetical protein B9S36_01960 [Verrucomicrobiae bacterium Tous-C2TDCM]
MNRVSSILVFLAGVAMLRAADAATVSFENDVLPVLTRAGCMAGSCHAKADGQNGFQLSIFSFDPDSDYREIVYDARGRRVFPSSPDHSLLLLKATNAVPHEGEQRLEKGSEFYEVLRRWIAEGAPRRVEKEPDLIGLAIEPAESTFQKGQSKQIKVIASYSDGMKREVTHLSEYTSNDRAFASVDHDGKITAGKVPGENSVIVRYVDQVAAMRLVIPPDTLLPAERYTALPRHGKVDDLAYARFQDLGLYPSEPCRDDEFLRRATLDVLGRLPSIGEAKVFLDDTDPDKRTKLVERLLGPENRFDYADYWSVKWGDLLRPNTQRVGVKPVYLLDQWIREKFRDNTTWDAVVTELLTAAGSSHEYGPVAVIRDKREAADMAEFVSQLFLGVRLNCAKCHHHPSERWSQDDYYSMAAFFGSMKQKGQGISAPISGEPEYWWFEPGGKVTHPVSEAVMVPRPPGGEAFAAIDAKTDPRKVFAGWLTGKDNPHFSKAMVNRIWAEMFGRGLVDPVDDFRDSNPPVNAPLLDWLAKDFAEHGFDQKHTLRVILNSRLYQQSSVPNEHNVADQRNFSRSYRRRLSGEVLLDAISEITGQPEKLTGLPADARAMQQWNHLLPSDFLDAFGRPDSSAAPPCERETGGSVVQALHLMNSDGLQKKLSAKSPWLEGLVARAAPETVEEVYLRLFSRKPADNERQIALSHLGEKPDRAKIEDLVWSLLNSAEFVLNH